MNDASATALGGAGRAAPFAVLARQRKRFLGIALLVVLAAAVGISLPNVVILHPPHRAMVSTGATRLLLPFRDGHLEVWTARSRAPRMPDAGPDAYVLRFYGNADQSDPNVGREAAGWSERNLEFWGVNYPGYGGSSGAARLSAIGPAALAAYDALRARAGAARPVLVFGTSLGTSAALCVAARRPDVAGVVLQNPPPFRQIILRGWGWWNLWLVAGPAALAIPSEIESVPNARACHRRAVFLLSQQDEVVRPRYARLVLGAYAGEKRVIRLPGARHNSPLDAAETRALHADVAWLLAAAPRAKP